MPHIVKIKTGSRFEDHGGYSRLVAVDDWIFLSNTAGREPHSQEIPEDVAAQTLQVLANIERALAAVDARLADIVSTRIFIQNPADTHAVMTVVGETFRGIDPACTVTCPPLGSTVYKVEIEATAHRGAGDAVVEKRTLAL